MDSISFFIKNCTKKFNEIFNSSFNSFNLEDNIIKFGDYFTINLFIKYLEDLDLEFKSSKERKEKYYVKETKERTLLTSIGYITINCTRYQDKETKKSYIFLRDILNLKPYQRMTEHAEYSLIKYAMNNNMSQAALNALRNTPISRSTVSKKIKNLKGSIHEIINRVTNQPKVLYIEMDEIHANLQSNKNHICPCAIVHEGHKENFVKRKELKNVYNFASSNLSYDGLWNVVYDYVDKKYDIDKFDAIFISGDGAKGIKAYQDVFPNAIFVLDKFHYRKALNYIFKTDELMNIADSYIRNDKIEDFKTLLNYQIKENPTQEKYIRKKAKTILNNIEGIKNQRHPLYKCPCSMEGHVSNRYARYITSSPYAFSKEGLENKLKLLVLNANKHELTFNEFLKLKYSENEYEKLNKNIEELQTKQKIKIPKNIKNTINNIDVSIPKFDNNKYNDHLKNIIKERKEIYVI